MLVINLQRFCSIPYPFPLCSRQNSSPFISRRSRSSTKFQVFLLDLDTKHVVSIIIVFFFYYERTAPIGMSEQEEENSGTRRYRSFSLLGYRKFRIFPIGIFLFLGALAGENPHTLSLLFITRQIVRYYVFQNNSVILKVETAEHYCGNLYFSVYLVWRRNMTTTNFSYYL